MTELTPKTYKYQLLSNVHMLLPPPAASNGAENVTHYTRGDVDYFHYGCDGVQDSGWGCAYRTLQSSCSWVLSRRGGGGRSIPSIREIQETLVRIGDKTRAHVGSRDWIGAMEVFFVLDSLYDVPCKILHIPQREELHSHAAQLQKYFEEFGGFVMMGGDVDAAAKGIAGVHISGNDAYFLVVDPHFVGVPKSPRELIERGYIRWQHTSKFVDSSFYNLCLPQLKV